jgi:hypothetical protein
MLVIAPVNSQSHHSFSADFIPKVGAIEGEVVRIFFRNPHTHFYIKVINENGEEEEWDAHGQNLRVMMRVGWNRNTVKIGDKVKIEGNLGRDNSHNIAIMRLTMEDGKQLMPFPGNLSGFVSSFEDSQIEDETD